MHKYDILKRLQKKIGFAYSYYVSQYNQKSHFIMFPDCIPAFELKHQNLHIKGDAWFWFWSCLLLCVSSRYNSGWKSLPLAASPLFCTTCGFQSKHAVSTYHIWHVPSLELPDWSVVKCCGLVFWATDSFLFSEASKHPPHPAPWPAPTPNTNRHMFSVLPDSSSLTGGNISSYSALQALELVIHVWAAVSTVIFFSCKFQSVCSDGLGTFPRLSACCSNSRCV